jgi:hypothetical protein
MPDKPNADGQCHLRLGAKSILSEKSGLCIEVQIRPRAYACSPATALLAARSF